MTHDTLPPLATASTDYTPVEAYRGLRDRVLRFAAEVRSALLHEAVGALMETGHDGAAVTLVALFDSTTSLYFSSGGGIIGAGQHKPVAAATAKFLRAAGESPIGTRAASSFPLPGRGRTQFFVLTTEGAWTAEAAEQDLGYNRHPLSPLFHLGHAVIAAIRKHSSRPGEV